MVDAVIFAQGGRHLLACGRLECEQICPNTAPRPLPGEVLPGEVPTEVRRVRQRDASVSFGAQVPSASPWDQILETLSGFPRWTLELC